MSLNNKRIFIPLSPLIESAEIAKKNNGKLNKNLFPIAKRIAINKDKTTIKLRTPFAIFFVFWLVNQDKNKNTAIKNMMERKIIFM